MSLIIYLLIFVAKVIEVSMATVRIVLITRGERFRGAVIGFFEVGIWVVLVSTVLVNLVEDPLKVLVYALGFSVGNYVGSRVEEALAIGTTRIEVIVLQEDGHELADKIRSKGYAVTVVAGEGRDMARSVLILHVQRKRAKAVIAMIQRYQENSVITVNEIKPVYGGFGTLKR